MDRVPGLSVRLKLTLSYAGFLMLAGALLLAAAWLAGRYRQSFEFLLRYVPDVAISTTGSLVPGNSNFLLAAYAPAAAIVLAFLLVFGLVGGWLLAGRMLAPLTRITDATRMAANRSLSHRIRLSGRSDEFRELADAFDTMLMRLEAHVAEQQRFAANASHELRTPLTVMQTLLDVARRDPAGQDYPTLLERLSITNARAIGLTEALLRLADANANAVTAVSEPIDIAVIARDAVAAHVAEADQLGVTLEVRLETATMVGDDALLVQLVSNLVQNAIRHNHAAGTVRIVTSHDRQRAIVSLRIENTGAVYTPELAAQLSEPFLRGSGRVSQRDPAKRGYGLGLTLVARITEVHHGELAIEPRHGGGLVVTVTLPAASPGVDRVPATRHDRQHAMPDATWAG